MIRVCRKGIILINEPCDMYIFDTSRQILFRWLVEKLSRIALFRKFLGEIKKHTYEEAGNYVYKISRREIEKVALGLNLHYVAYKGFNIANHIISNYEERIGPDAPNYKKIKFRINMFNMLSKLKLSQPTNFIAIIFIEPPSKETIAALRKNSYNIIELPENPYAQVNK